MKKLQNMDHIILIVEQLQQVKPVKKEILQGANMDGYMIEQVVIVKNMDV